MAGVSELKCYWESLQPGGGNPLLARSRHSCCQYKSDIYSFGGIDESEESYLDTRRFDIHDHAWTKVPCIGDVPHALSCSSVTSYDTSVWLFGGFDRQTDSSINSLYKLDMENKTWRAVSPRGDLPPARNSHTMVTCDGVMIVFGGWDGQTFFDDVHLLHSHGTTWSTVSAASWQDVRPCARMGHSASMYRSSMFVFGGFLHPATLSDFWEFNVVTLTWEKISVPGGPSDRYRHSSVVIGEYLFVFGGVNAAKERFSDVWCFDIPRRTWTLVDTGLSQPSARCLHQAVALDGAMYVFGGVGEGGKKLGETYRLITPFFTERQLTVPDDVPMQWTERVGRPPLLEGGRTGHICFVHDADFFVFGGAGPDGALSNEVFSLDFKTLTWKQQECVGDVPPPLSSAKVAAVEDSIFVYGGMRLSSYSNALYHFSIPARRWSRIVSFSASKVAPTGRVDHSIALVGQDLVVFGGLHRKEVLNDVWAFSLADRTWNALRPGVRPPARFGHTAVTHFSNQQMLVFGGWDGQQLLGDLWILDLSCGWKQLKVPNGPCGRYRHTATVVLNRYMCIFGGVTENQVRLNDIFLFDMQRLAWTNVSVLGPKVPPARTFHEAAVMDGDRMIVFGGRGGSGVKLGDVWSISLANPVDDQQLQIEQMRKRIMYLESKVVCKVCMEKEINAVLIPCAHRCVCLSCASVIVNRDCICPICRVTIVRLVETIDA